MMKIRFLIIFVMLFSHCLVVNGDNIIVLKSDFNNDMKLDSIVYRPNVGITTFYISKEGNTMNVSSCSVVQQVLKSNDLNLANTFVELSVDDNKRLIYEIEMTGRGAYYETFYFSFISNKFILVKMSTGSVNKGDFDGYSQKCMCDFMQPIDMDLFNYESVKTKFGKEKNCNDRFLIKKSFEDIYKSVSENKSIDNPKMQRLEYYLNEYPLCASTLRQYNDIAYYLEKGSNYVESIYILEKVIEKYPNRTVAYINLGDAYWGLEEKDNAKQAYQKYIGLMKASGKECKIPKRVFERINIE